MAFISKTNSFTSGTTISASQVNTNFDDIINGLSDGTKDIGVNNATFTGGVDANSTLQVAGATTLSSTVRVAGGATFSGAVGMDSTLRCADAAVFSGTVGITGVLTANGAATFASAVYNESTIRVGGNATFSGNVANAGTLKVSGAATFSGAISIGGDLHNDGSTNPLVYSTSSTVNGFPASAQVAINIRKTGKHRDVMFELITVSGTSNTCDFTIPENSASLMPNAYANPVFCSDNSSYAIGYALLPSGSNKITIRKTPTDFSWTVGTPRQIIGEIKYEVD